MVRTHYTVVVQVAHQAGDAPKQIKVVQEIVNRLAVGGIQIRPWEITAVFVPPTTKAR